MSGSAAGSAAGAAPASTAATIGDSTLRAEDVHALVQRIQAEEGVHTQVDAPFSVYITDLGHAFARWLDGLTGGVMGDQLGETALWVAVAVLAGLLAAIVAVTALRLDRKRRRRRMRWPGVSPAPTPAVDQGDASAALDRVHALLAAGRSRDALGCAWTWLARALDARGLGRWAVDRTEREFVATVDPAWSGRPALRRIALVVVRGVYGTQAPQRAEVERVVDEAQRLLAETGGTTP